MADRGSLHHSRSMGSQLQAFRGYYHSCSCLDTPLEAALSRIAAAVGKLVKIDPVTEKKLKGKFARLCVEIDLTRPPPPHVKVSPELSQLIEYEGLHVLCYQCGLVGHLQQGCSYFSSVTNSTHHHLASQAPIASHNSSATATATASKPSICGPQNQVPPRQRLWIPKATDDSGQQRRQVVHRNVPIETGTAGRVSRFQVREPKNLNPRLMDELITPKEKSAAVAPSIASTSHVMMNAGPENRLEQIRPVQPGEGTSSAVQKILTSIKADDVPPVSSVTASTYSPLNSTQPLPERQVNPPPLSSTLFNSNVLPCSTVSNQPPTPYQVVSPCPPVSSVTTSTYSPLDSTQPLHEHQVNPPRPLSFALSNSNVSSSSTINHPPPTTHQVVSPCPPVSLATNSTYSPLDSTQPLPKHQVNPPPPLSSTLSNSNVSSSSTVSHPSPTTHQVVSRYPTVSSLTTSTSTERLSHQRTGSAIPNESYTSLHQRPAQPSSVFSNSRSRSTTPGGIALYTTGMLSSTQEQKINIAPGELIQRIIGRCPTVFTMKSKVSNIDIRVNILPLHTGNGNQHEISFAPSVNDHTMHPVPCSNEEKILIWNCLGAEVPMVIPAMKEICKMHQISSVLLFGTRIAGIDAQHVIKDLGFSHSRYVEAPGFAGGVCLLGHKEVHIDVSSTASHYQIHASVQFLLRAYDSTISGVEGNTDHNE